MKRARAVRVKASLFAGVLSVVGWSAAATPAQAAVNWQCSSGYVCFYSMPNGYGQKCSWQGNDDNWRFEPDGVCSWAHYDSVGSVYNNGTSGMDVLYYDAPGSHGKDKVGCVSKGEKKNLTSTYYLKSHLWVSGNNC